MVDDVSVEPTGTIVVNIAHHLGTRRAAESEEVSQGAGLWRGRGPVHYAGDDPGQRTAAMQAARWNARERPVRDRGHNSGPRDASGKAA